MITTHNITADEIAVHMSASTMTLQDVKATVVVDDGEIVEIEVHAMDGKDAWSRMLFPAIATYARRNLPDHVFSEGEG